MRRARPFAEPQTLETLPLPARQGEELPTDREPSRTGAPGGEGADLNATDPHLYPEPDEDEQRSRAGGGDLDVPEAGEGEDSETSRPPRQRASTVPAANAAFEAGKQKPGQPSKNPAGRPPGTPNPGLILRILDEKLPATDFDGTLRDIPVVEILRRKALLGKSARMRRVYDAEMARQRPEPVRPPSDEEQYGPVPSALKTDQERSEWLSRARDHRKLHECMHGPLAPIVEVLFPLMDLGVIRMVAPYVWEVEDWANKRFPLPITPPDA